MKLSTYILKSFEHLGLLRTYYPHLYLPAARGERSWGEFRDDLDQPFVSPAVVDFLDQDYYFKLVDTQIPHDAGFASFRPAGD